MESPEIFSGLNVSKQMAGFSDGGGHLALDMVHEATEEKIVTETGEPQSAMVAQELSSGNRSCVMCSAHLKNKTTCGEQGLQSEADWLPEGQCKKGQKSQKPGKYVCHYCGRACAKPSVLKKHIRSHTGERPYPCIPCGFSFKTKSNLYKHRKSHTHAVKAGLVSLSKQDSKDISMDEDFQSGDGEAHTDAEQSSDSDEEDVEDVSLDSSSPTCPLDRGGTGQETGGSLLQEEPVTLLNTMSSGSDLSASGKISLWQFREKMRAPVHQVDQSMESCTIKQRLALRLTEKRNQDSDHSLSLPSSYSKGSTDSGYFSRSESAEQQANQPSVSVKSYQEIMFGKCYRPISKPKQSITVQTCVTDTNDSTSSFMVKLKKRNVSRQTMPHLLRSIKADTESLQEEDYQESDIFSPFQSTSVDLDVPSDVGSFTRSNSLPAAESDTGSPQGLRNSSSFDERMINDRGSGGMRRLRRQTAFEHSAHEGHPDSDNHSTPACSVQKPEMKCFKMSENVNIGMENNPEIEPLMHQSHVMETVTRKRRKDKGEVKEDELSKQKSIDISGLSRDLYSNQLNPTSFEQKETTHHLPDCYNLMSVSLKDTDNRLGMNAISVIQHTNSVGRLHFGEKSQKWDVFYLSDTENYKNAKTVEPLFPSSEGNSRLISERLNVSHHQICQSIIQVPEIRVTEEPDGAEKVAETQGKLREKAVECFQWPQRSETLAQFPVEKLPPKKKRLRLAEMEHSSGESSFESACTSFSKSPSQDSNTSHFSSFSMSLEREEITTPCPTKQDEFAKHIELLAVPGGGHTLSLPSPNHNKEMRRSSSELAPCTLPVEVPEFRSKSFDYGNLSPSSRQGEVCSSSFIKARRRGHLVRQASLSFDPEIVLHEKCMDMSVVEKGSGHVHECLCPATCPVCPSPVLKEEVFARVQHVKDILAVHQEAGEICSVSSTDKPATEEMSSSEKKNWPLSCGRILEQMPDWHPQLDPQEIQNLPCTQLQHLKNEQGDSRTVTSHVGFRDSLEDCLQHLINVQALPDHQIVYNHCAQPLHTGSSVPVRIQMDIPCYGKMTYTSMSRLDSQTQSINRSKSVTEITTPSSFVCPPSQLISGHPRGLLCNSQLSPAKLNTGIPLSLTSKTISTTEAPSGGASKRMLSPASSIEVFIEATQQKRLKEEKMYGQIVEELSAVELGAPIFAKEIKEEAKSKTHPQTEELSLVSGQSTPKASKAILSSITPHFKVVRPSDSLTTPPQTITDSMDEASEPTQDTGDDGPNGVSPQVLMANKQHISGELTASCSRAFGASILLNQIVGAQLFSQFPSLHTTTCVSWCYLSSTRPNSSQTRPLFSVYSASFVRGHNPNPLSLSTRTALALLRVKQSRHDTTYTIASMCPPEILATSTTWKETQEQDMLDCKEKDIKHGTRIRDIFRRSKLVKEESKESEASQDQTGPARIKIFEGGFKSNEEYVYVRGRGRGKYICEECGIRCKKPSMLKKHIRTHTDVRPYICKCCNFAFKTKGNLTKHMKSKAHMKKCLELGVSPVTIDSTEDADIESGIQRESLHTSTEDSRIKHQFSVLDDSDGGEEDGDELDDEEDEEYDDDSTPTSVSRSTSPQPCLSSIVSLSSLQKPSSREECGITQPVGTDNSPQHNPSKLRKDETITLLSPEQASIFNPWSSHTLSPFWESTTQRYLWPADDLSPQGHLSPRRDISPLRAVSPRRELSLRGDLSPLRHPSPGGVVSPGVEVSRQRVFSPRARHRGVPRAGSPRRVSSQHRPLLDQGRSTGPLRQSNRGDAGTELYRDERESILQNLSFPVDLSKSKEPSTPAHRDIFSHLPLHSQQQTHTAVPMIPIGGIRMPSLPSAGNPVPSNTEAPPPGTLPKTSSLSQAPADVLGLVDQHQLEVKPSTCMRSSQQRTSAPANQGNKQEENVQICAEAIASLKITSEDFAKATGFQVHFT